MEEMVSANHLLRQIDATIDFNKILEFVESLYSKDNGWPSIDPFVPLKIVLVQHIYGIPLQALSRAQDCCWRQRLQNTVDLQKSF
ncbi:hypothetical protein [Gemmiger formicilis]|uniref:hypothetical protein n=1 Tax=Gemmiger formicilis TaxID=745368 RepID=UPI0031F6A95F